MDAPPGTLYFMCGEKHKRGLVPPKRDNIIIGPVCVFRGGIFQTRVAAGAADLRKEMRIQFAPVNLEWL